MESISPPNLLLQAEKILPQPAHAHLIACCPTMDLVAIVNQDEQLNVYRFGGQRAFGLHRREDSRVLSLGWKFNGQYLAVGWSDGIVEVVSAETGNVLQHFRQASLSGGRSKDDARNSGGVTCVGWGLNFIDIPSVKSKTGVKANPADTNPFDGMTTDNWNEEQGTASLDDFLERIPDAKKIEIPLELPEMLARISVSSTMSKLPALPLLPPAAYKQGDHPAAELFASQLSLDAALLTGTSQVLGQNVYGLEALLLAQDSGLVRLILYDSLGIGNVSIPLDWKIPNLKFRRCAFHPYSSTYMFLVDIPSENGQSRTALLPLSLRFLHSSGSQLHIIESKTAQLELLIQYVGETLLAINHHWKHSKELPARFMQGVNETLAEKDEPNLVQILFHLAATGDSPPTLKEWLVDILAERGHKRWDHAITHGYTKVLELTHENLLPALDRCASILSHLRGLAIYYEHSTVFNVPSAAFDIILSIIRCMRLLVHHLLLFCSEELQQFNVFSKWLRREIDIQASDPAANPPDDAEQDFNIDHSLLLAYIQGPLEASRLDPFVTLGSKAPKIMAQAGIYEDIKIALAAFKNDDEEGELGPITLGGYFDEWMRHNQILVDQITSHQRASSSITCGLVLQEGEILVDDIRMVFEELDARESSRSAQDSVSTFTAIVKKKTPSQVNFLRVIHAGDFDDLESIETVTSHTLQFPSNIKVLDLKFVDDENIMLLVADTTSSHLLSFAFRGPHADVTLISAVKGDLRNSRLPKGKPLQSSNASKTISVAGHVKHTFEAGDRLTPMKIEINGRKGRRFVVVLGADMRQMRILDLDFKEGEEKVEDAREGSGQGNEDEVMSD